MILFIDDETGRTRRWRQALEDGYEVKALATAGEALGVFQQPELMQDVDLVVLDMALHATGGLTAEETTYGRLTGEVLLQRLRDSGWSGPVIVLTNTRDDSLKERIQAGDNAYYYRKNDCMPSKLRQEVDALLKHTPAA